MKTYLKLLSTLLLLQSYVMVSTAQSCSGVINTFPLNQSFEDPTNLWDQWSSAPYPWLFAVGGTGGGSGTSPSGASDGLGYMYVDATDQTGAGVILSPCFDMTSLTTPTIFFDYHLYGPDAFRFIVQLSTNGGATWGPIIFSAIGDQGPGWKSETIDLTQYGNSTNMRFRFIGVVNGVGSNDLGDVALDNITIGEGPICFDISVNYSNISCTGSNDGDATVLISPANTPGLSVLWSNGETTNSISNLPPGNYSVEVTDNNQCTKTKYFHVFETLPLNVDLYITPASGAGNADGSIQTVVSGGIGPYIYSWKNGSTGATNSNIANGYEELTLTDANGCTVQLPTFVPVEDPCSGVYGNWPYHLSFDSGLGRFTQGDDDNINWKRRSGSTPTSNTGPSGAIQGSKYRYLESSGSGSPFKTGVIVSKKCFNISNLPNPELYFQYHMYGADMGQLFVQTSTDGGSTWRENIWEVSGNQGNAWQEAFIDLSGVSSSTLMIRIVGRTGSGNLSDIAIDDLHIRTAGTNLRPDLTSTRSGEIDNPEMTAEKLISKFYPNPVNDKLTVVHAQNISALNVIDMQGQRVLSINPTGAESILDLNELTLGMYILQAVDNAGKISVQKILKI